MKDPDKSKISSILGKRILVLPRSDLDMLNAIFFTGFPVSKLHGFSFKSQGKTCITDTKTNKIQLIPVSKPGLQKHNKKKEKEVK